MVLENRWNHSAPTTVAPPPCGLGAVLSKSRVGLQRSACAASCQVRTLDQSAWQPHGRNPATRPADATRTVRPASRGVARAVGNQVRDNPQRRSPRSRPCAPPSRAYLPALGISNSLPANSGCTRTLWSAAPSGLCAQLNGDARLTGAVGRRSTAVRLKPQPTATANRPWPVRLLLCRRHRLSSSTLTARSQSLSGSGPSASASSMAYSGATPWSAATESVSTHVTFG